MSDTGLTIKIGSTADTKGFDQATESLHRSTEAAHEFVNAIKLGVGIDLGGKLVESIREIPNLLREAVAEGVKFNALMQSSQIAIAGGFKSMDSSLSFDEAKQKGGEALDYLMEKSKAMGLDFESVVETFKVNVPTMFAAGIHDAQKMADTIVLLNQVAASKGIEGFQAQRDIIDLLNGQGERTILGKELTAQGVSNEQIEKWKEAGVLAEMLKEKFAAIAEAGAASADTYDGSLNRLKTTWAQLLGDLSKPVFEELQQAFKELAAELDSPEGKKGLQELGYSIRDLVKLGAGLAEWAAKNAGNLALMGASAGALGVTLAALKLGQIVSGLTGLGVGLSKNTTLWAAEAVAVEANTAAKVANAEAGAAAAAAGGAGGAGKLARLANGLTAAVPVASGAVAAEGAAVGAATAGGIAASLTKVGAAAASAAVVFGRLTIIGSALYATWEASKGIMIGWHDRDIAQGIMGGKEKYGGYDRSQLQASATKVSSVKERQELLIEIEKYRGGLGKAYETLGYWDGAKKKAIDQELQYVDLLQKQVQNTSPEKMAGNAAAKAAHDKELNDKAAAEKQAAEEEENRKANAKREETRKEADAEREARLANETAAAQAKSASERGEYSTYASDRGADLKKQLAATPSLRDEEGWEGKYTATEVDKRDKLRAALEADIKQMAKAQDQADMDTWKERDRREQEITRAKLDALKEQERLEQAQADKKIAAIEASGAKESEIAAQRKQVEDDLAMKRLDLENQIGALEGESSTARLTRQTEYEAKQIARDKKPEGSKAPQDLSNYTVEKDTSGNVTAYVPLGKGNATATDAGTIHMPEVSRLAQFKQKQSQEWQETDVRNIASAQARNGTAVAQQPPMPGPANNPASTADAGSGAGRANPAQTADPGKKVDELTKTISEKLKSLESSLTKATEASKSAGESVGKAGTAAEQAAGSLSKKIAELAARLEKLERA